MALEWNVSQAGSEQIMKHREICSRVRLEVGRKIVPTTQDLLDFHSALSSYYSSFSSLLLENRLKKLKVEYEDIYIMVTELRFLHKQILKLGNVKRWFFDYKLCYIHDLLTAIQQKVLPINARNSVGLSQEERMILSTRTGRKKYWEDLKNGKERTKAINKTKN